MKLDTFATIRGTEVRIVAEEFDGDPSVGIGYGPECVWAETLDDPPAPFELTDEETALYILEFSQRYQEMDYDDFD